MEALLGALKGLLGWVENATVTGRACRSVAGVVVVATLLGALIVGARVLSRSETCCRGQHPYISLYDRPLSHVDRVLADGDGQAFGAIAQDPLLRRPQVIGSRADYAYRAQRPLWGYLAWAGSLGDAGLVGWVLAVMTVLSCGAASMLFALLLRERRANVWWSLLVPVIGLQVLTEFTSELAAVALLFAGILLWSRERRVAAVVMLCLAALTRESMLVGVVGLGVWELHRFAGTGRGLRRAAPLAWPLGVYGAWVVIVTLRLGVSPFARSGGRLGLPGAGLVATVTAGSNVPTVVSVASLAIVVLTAAIVVARRDVLTWVAVSYLIFATTLGRDVWGTQSGINRTLLPLFLAGAAAILGGLRARQLERIDRISSELTINEPHVELDGEPRVERVPVAASKPTGSP